MKNKNIWMLLFVFTTTVVMGVSGVLLYPEFRRWLAVQRLTRAIREKDPAAFGTASDDVLATGAGEEAAVALLHLIQDEDPGVRTFSTIGFFHFRTEAAVYALARALSDEDKRVRVAAAYVLKHFGAKAEHALPALRDVAACDPDDEVRRVAVDAIQSIVSELSPEGEGPR